MISFFTTAWPASAPWRRSRALEDEAPRLLSRTLTFLEERQPSPSPHPNSRPEPVRVRSEGTRKPSAPAVHRWASIPGRQSQ